MSKNNEKGRWVTEEQLEELVQKRVAQYVASITQRAANRARGEGREELAKTWEYLSLVALSNMKEP
jgi:hypothetical protein